MMQATLSSDEEDEAAAHFESIEIILARD